ncbi:MAG: diacylglycerol kinase family protein [Sphingobacteriaceae bacterium]
MKKFLKGFVYAWQGVKYAFSTQINFQFHSIAAILTFALACFFNLNIYEWLWISVAIAIVIIAELFNTAIEVLVDLVSPEYHPKAGVVKDLASAAVLFTAFLSAIIGLCIFVPKFLHYAS